VRFGALTFMTTEPAKPPGFAIECADAASFPSQATNFLQGSRPEDPSP
jgi:hypothetical protein